MKITIIDTIIPFIDKSIEEYYKITGSYPSCLKMTSLTFDAIIALSKDLYWVLDNGDKKCYYKGFDVVICNDLVFGDIDLS